MDNPIGFCTLCNIDIPSFEGLSGCPNCKTRNLPCGYADDRTVKINLREIHILCVWAERWGMSIAEEHEGGPGIVYAIVQRLKQRNEKLADESLTLADEMDGLRDAGYQFETNLPGVENNVTYNCDLCRDTKKVVWQYKDEDDKVGKWAVGIQGHDMGHENRPCPECWKDGDHMEGGLHGEGDNY